MSSCNALPQIWAISPTRTMGCDPKRSCNGVAAMAAGALQDLFAGPSSSASVGVPSAVSNAKGSCNGAAGLTRL